MKKDAKIYVAGHTGLIGTALIEKLRSEHYSHLLLKTHSELDLTDRLAVFDFFEKENPEYVFLAAGLNGGIVANQTYPADFFEVNISIQNNVFRAANMFNVKHLVFYGSSCMYPKDSLEPLREEDLLKGEIEKTSEAYAAAKIAGVIACRAYNQQNQNRRFIALVPNSVFGPGDHFASKLSHVLASLVFKFYLAQKNNINTVELWGSGCPKREFIFAEDVADASLFAMNNVNSLANHHYNVGTGVDYSISELADMIRGIVDYKGQILWDREKPEGAYRKILDSSKILALGWRPRITLLEGIRLTYDWLQREYESVKKEGSEVNA